MINQEVKRFTCFEAAAEGLGIGIKLLKRYVRGGTEYSVLRGNDGQLWTITIEFNKAVKLVPAFEGDIPVQNFSSITAAIRFLGVTRRTFDRWRFSVETGETFVIKDCYRREWLAVCYIDKQEYPFVKKGGEGNE